MIQASLERTVNVQPQVMIDRIWSGIEWQQNRHGICGVAVEYDDGEHQTMHLCVDWKPDHLTISIIRFRDSAFRISYFYSQPPPRISRQSGAWEAWRHVANGCVLRLTRRLELTKSKNESDSSHAEREKMHGQILQEHLGLILNVVGVEDPR